MTRHVSNRRNLGIIAHVDAGKTTLTERVLFHTGRIHRAGGVDQGDTITDHRPEEQSMGITITAAAVSCEWRGYALSLIDTPGHVDFTMEVERSLRVLDGAVVLLDGVVGVEPQTETVWRQADKHGVPRLAFVNKLDRAGADFGRSLQSLEERFGVRPLALSLPAGDPLDSVIDVITGERVFHDEHGHELRREPCAARAREEAHERLVEAAAELDETILEGWLAGQLDSTELLALLRRGTIEGRWLPTFAGSAFRNIGVPLLLDGIVALLPSPEEASAVVDRATGAARARLPREPLTALCFKVDFDSFGALAFLRVYSGVLRRGDSVAVGQGRGRLRVGRLVRLFADQREEVEFAVAGEIVALVGGELATGDTLSALEQRFALEPIETPASVMRVAIEPRTRADRERLPKALGRLRLADPSLRVLADAETGQTLLGGMGELHLEIATRRLRSEHGVEVAVGAPRVAYRETIGREIGQTVRVEHVHKKRSGGPGQFAHVVLEFERLPAGEGFRFEDLSVGGAIPKEYLSGLRKGALAAMSCGLLGHPVVDVGVRVLGGSTHVQDSSELSFAIAAEAAFRRGSAEAGPALLEPLVQLEVATPEAHVGDVVGDLSSRRARVLDLAPRGGVVEIRAEVPLAELFGYASRLGSLTSGRGSHRTGEVRYAPAPDGVEVRA